MRPLKPSWSVIGGCESMGFQVVGKAEEGIVVDDRPVAEIAALPERVEVFHVEL